MGFRYHCREKPGRPINAFKSDLHLCSILCTSTNKRSFLQALLRTNIQNNFTQVASSFICARAQGRAGQRAGLNTALGLGTVVSRVNSDFLFTRKDLRPLWFLGVSVLLVSGFVCTRLQMACLTTSPHLALHKKISIQNL